VRTYAEPMIQVTVTTIVELVEVFKLYAEEHKEQHTEKEFEEITNRHNYYYERAATKLVAYNRKTIQDA